MTLPSLSRRQLIKGLAAASLALACGVGLATIAAGLAAVQPVPGRQVAHELGNGVVLVPTYRDRKNDRRALDILRRSLAAVGGGGVRWR